MRTAPRAPPATTGDRPPMSPPRDSRKIAFGNVRPSPAYRLFARPRVDSGCTSLFRCPHSGKQSATRCMRSKRHARPPQHWPTPESPWLTVTSGSGAGVRPRDSAGRGRDSARMPIENAQRTALRRTGSAAAAPSRCAAVVPPAGCPRSGGATQTPGPARSGGYAGEVAWGSDRVRRRPAPCCPPYAGALRRSNAFPVRRR